MTDYVVVSTEGAIGRIEINRPRARNALNSAMADEVRRAVISFGEDASCRGILICGSREVFGAGADLKEVPPDAELPWAQRSHARMLQAVQGSNVPIAVAVEGWAVGISLGLIAAATFAVGAEDSRYWLPETGLGYFPFGVVGYLARRTPPSAVMSWAISGEVLNLEQARASNVVTHAAPAGHTEDVARELLEKLSAIAPEIVGDAVAFVRHASAEADAFVRWCDDQMTNVSRRRLANSS